MKELLKIENNKVLLNGFDISNKVKLSSYDFKLLAMDKEGIYKNRLIGLIRQRLSRRVTK